MKFLGSVLFLALAAAEPGYLASNLSPQYTFEQFQVDFSKNYTCPKEKEHRRKVFETALNVALKHNADPAQNWKRAINQFADRTPEEFRNSHGWLPSWGLDLKFEPYPEIPADFKLSDLPPSVDWRNVTTPVKNQGMCGSCWAFSSTENVESRVAIDTGKLIELSPQNLVSCDPNPKHCGGQGGCRGSVPELAFDFVIKNGLASEASYPYVSGHTSKDEDCKKIAPAAFVKSYVKLQANNYTQVMHALATVGPLAINVDAIPMQSYGGGVFDGCSMEKTHIDHVIQLVGYGHDDDTELDYWLVRNSWDTTWGEAGYMRLTRHTPPNDKWCGIDIYPADGTGCDGGPGTVTTCGSCGLLYDVSYPTGGTVAPSWFSKTQ
mmetsp:Transcript_38333/g.75478  ORF Transcript_38333/g.75478 Transcript_38333/m.75478 type:complete len:378 (+) Transcript_38333:29-1162(+)|eukprot:CAMPEP_0175121554 /NCGR_PEP_ID=MMETSP0087-20121206/1226_1 /TAXON_ID=136419 /ORGANISM="Unknown Unknown, Strain D1" /LENGTH=377 /DNA_ID=CAMNT_0016403095 /DNA_START=28 /DNA_END=1161 /DNA_ORIENTATION=+